MYNPCSAHDLLLHFVLGYEIMNKTFLSFTYQPRSPRSTHLPHCEGQKTNRISKRKGNYQCTNDIKYMVHNLFFGKL